MRPCRARPERPERPTPLRGVSSRSSLYSVDRRPLLSSSRNVVVAADSATSSPLPLAGEGQGGGTRKDLSQPTPLPHPFPPRKRVTPVFDELRGREHTKQAAR